MGRGFAIWRCVGFRGGLVGRLDQAHVVARSGSTCMFSCSVLRVQRRCRRQLEDDVHGWERAAEGIAQGADDLAVLQVPGNGRPKGDALKSVP